MFKARSGEIFNQGVCSWFVTMAVTNITKNRQKVPNIQWIEKYFLVWNYLWQWPCL